MCGFFTRKNESLLQLFVEVVFKGIFNSIFIAVLATFIMSQVGRTIELSDKRRAFNEFRNARITEVFKFVSSGFGQNLSCARLVATIKNADCQTKLNEFHVALKNHIGVLKGVVGVDSANAVEPVEASIAELISASSSGEDLNNAIAEFESSLTNALTQIAKEFK